MKMMMLYPIQPNPNGVAYELVVGAVLLHVTENCGNYYLHALVDIDEEEHEMRWIAGYGDGQAIPNETGWYIDSAPCSYNHQQGTKGYTVAFHFFDQTKRGPQ